MSNTAGIPMKFGTRMAHQDRKLVTDFTLKPLAEQRFPKSPEISVLLIKKVSTDFFLGQNKTCSRLLFTTRQRKESSPPAVLNVIPISVCCDCRTRPPLRKSLFPVRRMAKIKTSREAGISFYISFLRY